MKYSRNATPLVFLCSLVMAAMLLSSCGGGGTKPDTQDKIENLTLKPTKQYLPVRNYDKEGNVIPFEPQPNPYEESKRRIDKTVIDNFIAARKAYKDQRYQQARNLLTQITEAEEGLAGPWVMLGSIAVKENDLALAEEHLRKAISVNRLNVNAYIPLAKLYRQKGDFVRAQNVYQQALTVWKDYPEAHLNLGILYDIYLNDPLQAQQHMEAYQFLTDYKDKTVKNWLQEVRSRTGIEANLYIGPPSASQIEETNADNS